MLLLAVCSLNLSSGSRLCLCVPTIKIGGEKIGLLTVCSRNLSSGSRLCLCVPTIKTGGEKIGLSELGFILVDA